MFNSGIVWLSPLFACCRFITWNVVECCSLTHNAVPEMMMITIFSAPNLFLFDIWAHAQQNWHSHNKGSSHTVQKKSESSHKILCIACHGWSGDNGINLAFLNIVFGPETVASAITVVTAFLCGYSGYIFGTVQEHNLGFCSEGFYWIFRSWVLYKYSQ